MRGDARPAVASVHPPPDPEVVAAIVAAVDQVWPRPVAAGTAKQVPSPWRFSGRWWALPTAVRRERPWIGGSR